MLTASDSITGTVIVIKHMNGAVTIDENHTSHDLDPRSNKDGQMVVMTSPISSCKEVTLGVGAKICGIGASGDSKGDDPMLYGEFRRVFSLASPI